MDVVEVSTCLTLRERHDPSEVRLISFTHTFLMAAHVTMKWKRALKLERRTDAEETKNIWGSRPEFC